MADTLEEEERRDRFERLENRANRLRDALAPLTVSKHHGDLWLGAGPAGNEYVPRDAPAGFQRRAPTSGRTKPLLPPAKLDEWLTERSLKLGPIAGDGKCQYRAISRALFGNEDKYAEDLKSLAVEFLRLYKHEFLEQVTGTELGPRKQIIEKLGLEANYDGWCDALNLCEEWGQEYTLNALSLLLLVEFRLVASMPRAHALSPPRILCKSVDPTARAGPPLHVAYLVLEQTRGRELYNTLEENLLCLMPPPPLVPGSQQPPGLVAQSSILSDSSARETDYDGLDEVMAGGELYSMSELLAGVTCGDNQHMYVAIDDKTNGEYLIFKHDLRTDCKELIRKIVKNFVPKQKKPSNRKAPSAAAPPARVLEADVEGWRAKLHEGPTATLALAQEIEDRIGEYIEALQLSKSATPDDTFYLDRLGSRMYALRDKAQEIRFDMFCNAHSESQPPFKIVIVGGEGSGKSTLVNNLLRNMMPTDDKLREAFSRTPSAVPSAASAASASAEPAVVVTDVCSQRFALEAEVNRAGIEAAQEQLKAEEAQLHWDVFNRKGQHASICRNMNPHKEDVLPTGAYTNALTALVTSIEFDPDATKVTLKLTYRAQDEVEEVLQAAESIRSQVLEARKVRGTLAPGDPALDNVPDVTLGDDQDVSMMAHKACAILNIKTMSNNAVDMLGDHKGAFELPMRFQHLMGRERRLTASAPTGDAMLKQLNEWLMLHTVGTWSHWGVLQAVECIIPSRNDIRMNVCDVPGFGTVKANPFRQSIVREMVVNCECSSLVLCLDAKRIDFLGKASADAFEEAGVYEALLGERLERRVGQVVTARCGNRIQTPLKPASLAPSLIPPCVCSNL